MGRYNSATENPLVSPLRALHALVCIWDCVLGPSRGEFMVLDREGKGKKGGAQIDVNRTKKAQWSVG